MPACRSSLVLIAGYSQRCKFEGVGGGDRDLVRNSTSALRVRDVACSRSPARSADHGRGSQSPAHRPDPGKPWCMPGRHQPIRYRTWTGRQRERPCGSPVGSSVLIKVVTEVGSALDGHRGKFFALLRDPAVSTIVVEHRDRFVRFGAEYVEAVLAAQGRRLLVVDPAEADDDLVGDVTETLTSLCVRLYGRRVAADRARRAVEVATGDPA